MGEDRDGATLHRQHTARGSQAIQEAEAGETGRGSNGVEAKWIEKKRTALSRRQLVTNIKLQRWRASELIVSKQPRSAMRSTDLELDA